MLKVNAKQWQRELWEEILNHIIYCWASLVTQMIENLPAMRET